ncbi:MAG: hypothetical protein IKG75_00550 [Bacteroidaceae bacterium]|nr:hypothetical protein [Bacteroidaceae bacterium]
MKSFTENDIRNVLQRKYSKMPPLSQDFSQRLFEAWEQQCRRRKAIRLYSFMGIAAAAATVVLLLTVNIGNPANSNMVAHHTTLEALVEGKPQPVIVSQGTTTGKSDNDAHVMDIPVESKNIVNNKVNQQGNNGSSSLQGGELPAVAESPEGDESPTVDLQETNSGTLSDNTQLLLASNSNEDHVTEEQGEEMPVYSEADLPITNMENYLYSKDELKKIEQLRKERLIADIKSTVERARYRLEEIEKSFAQN